MKYYYFREVFEACGENMSDSNVNVGRIDVFTNDFYFGLRGEVKGNEKEGSKRASTKERWSM